MPFWRQKLCGDRGDEELHKLQIRQVHQSRHEGKHHRYQQNRHHDLIRDTPKYSSCSGFEQCSKGEVKPTFIKTSECVLA